MGQKTCWSYGGTDKVEISHLLGLGLLSSGEKLVGKGQLYGKSPWSAAIAGYDNQDISTNLERSAETEDTVVGLLGGQTLDGSLDGFALLGDQVIESEAISVGPLRGKRTSQRIRD